jgi:hypothetical protein
MRKAAAEKGVNIYIGAQLLQEEAASWWNATDKNWNTSVLNESSNVPDYYIIHSYYTPYDTDSKAADILTSATTVTKNMMEYVTQSQTQAGVQLKPVALTEWNIFAVRSKQQASYINGMHATLVLGELLKNKYGLACRWDLANAWENGNDHGTFNAGDEPGIPKWNPRAVFYYMYYFQKYTGDHVVSTSVTGSADVVAYASTFDSKEAGVVVVNKGNAAQTINVDMKNYGYGTRFYIHTLTGGNDNGEFSLKVSVNDRSPSLASGGPLDFETIPARSASITGGIKFTAPAKSVTYVLIEHGDNVVTGLMEKKNDTVIVFPVPARDKIVIQLPFTGFTTAEMYDETGKTIYRAQLNPGQLRQEIKVTFLPGLYLIRVSGKKNVLVSKLIIE